MAVQAPRFTFHWQMASWPQIKTPLDPVAQLYQLLLPLESVEALYADWHPDGFDVWIIANNTTEADRDQIYDQEWSLMQQFPGLGVNFYLVDRSEVDPAAMINLDDADFFLRFPRLPHA